MSRIDQIRDWLKELVGSTAEAASAVADDAAGRARGAVDRVRDVTSRILEYVDGGYVPAGPADEVAAHAAAVTGLDRPAPEPER